MRPTRWYRGRTRRLQYIDIDRYIGQVSPLADQLQDTTVAAKLFCGLGDPSRLAIIRLLADGEHRVTDIVSALGRPQGTISGHLRCLKECGLVTDRRTGREAHYRIRDDALVDLLHAAERLLAVTGEHIELCPNYTLDGVSSP